jgi:hypothetical protein
VSLLRDPITWLRAVVRFRLQRRDPLGVIEAARKAALERRVPVAKTAEVQEP